MNKLNNATKEDSNYNISFLYLSCFGIIFVVCGHCGLNGILNNAFPFASFHMALFTFISGYFKKDNFKFLKKLKKLVISYYLWNIIYGFISLILKKIGLVEFGIDFSLKSIFITPLISNSFQFGFNAASWYLISIFFIQLFYFIFEFLIKKINNSFSPEYLILIIFLIFNYIYLTNLKNLLVNNVLYYQVIRIIFLMPFFALGQIYKKSEKLDLLNNIPYFLIIIILQTILLSRYSNITYNLQNIKIKYNYLVYFIASLNGILLFLRISKILSMKFQTNRIITYIGKNTYCVMMHHTMAIYLFDIVLYIGHKFLGLFDKFELKSMKEHLWYIYDKTNPSLVLIYIIVGVASPLLIKYLLEKIHINQKSINLLKNAKSVSIVNQKIEYFTK
jgi:fucose 4-O-acetylase-like acetyltransferase